jgi:hypothetical protein
VHSADGAGVDGGPGGDESGPGARPFWVWASIDASTLGAVHTLVDAVARHWASDEAARRFSRAVGVAAAEAVAAGRAMLNLWEEPGELVCHIARSAPASGPPASGRALASTDPGRVVVHVRRHEVTVRLTI